MPQLIASVEGVEIKHVYLTKDRTTLGRNPDNDIVFDNMVVSGRHCVFELKGLNEVFVEDLRSTNGTYVNGCMVRRRQRLHDGEVIAIGNFRIEYREATEKPSGFGASGFGNSGFGQTTAMRLDAGGMPRPLHAVFRVLDGSSAGLEVPVVKAVTTFGKPGVAVVAVSHRRDGFYVAHLDGSQRSVLNEDKLGDDPVMLSDHDVLSLAGTRMLFLLKD